jgi:hypothetical protein
VFDGVRIPLINPQRGIFKPQQMRFLLSIKTVFPKPGGKVWYDDQREARQTPGAALVCDGGVMLMLPGGPISARAVKYHGQRSIRRVRHARDLAVKALPSMVFGRTGEPCARRPRPRSAGALELCNRGSCATSNSLRPPFSHASRAACA